MPRQGMPLFGAHFSIAGGLHLAVAQAVRFQCPTLQLFTKSAAQWNAKPLSEDDVRQFRQAVTAAGLLKISVHDSYLINLAAPADELFQKSIDAFVMEWERTERLGLDHLVMHPGSHVGSGDDAGLRRVIHGLNEAAKRCQGFHSRVLIETTAGQGTNLGWRFEHLATILAGVEQPERYAVCVDTCHIFAAGYRIRTEQEFADTFGEFDRQIGLNRIALFHLNDSVKPLGGRVDRHAGIGLGEIGTSAFRMLVQDPRFQSVPMILETPKEDANGQEMDSINLRKLRRMAAR
jgi:deoxyribonuclease IV